MIILPGDSLAREEITIKVDILDIEGLIQMKFRAKTLNDLRGELGVEWVNLAGFARGKMDNRKRYNRDKKKRNDLLYDASANK